MALRVSGWSTFPNEEDVERCPNEEDVQMVHFSGKLNPAHWMFDTGKTFVRDEWLFQLTHFSVSCIGSVKNGSSTR